MTIADAEISRLASAVRAAEERIRPYIRETALEYSPVLSELCAGHVYLKLENLQLTGSFKIRGAFNKMLPLAAQAYRGGVVAASSGNHALAVAHVLDHLHLSGTVFMPRTVAPGKLARISRSKVKVELIGTDATEAETAARTYALQEGLAYISPYNDLDVIAGQGTLAIELANQLEHFDDVFIAVGGGGLISGVAAQLKVARPHARIVGCQPSNSPVMMESVRAGRILDLESTPTLSDGTAGGIETDAITFPLCQALVSEFVAVSEGEIGRCLKFIIDEHHQLIEGAAAVAVAALLARGEAVRGRTAVVVLCGGNIHSSTLMRALTTA